MMSRGADTMPPSVPLSFSNCFWVHHPSETLLTHLIQGKGEKGADALSERMSDAKLTCEEIKAFYRERAAAEEEYSKKLLKLAKMPLGSKEVGTLKASLAAVAQEMQAMGNA